ncbi:MAG TPA: hypothetical protein VGB37_03560 [Candidatus Lokiarchaeia archaeon]
MDLKKLFQPKSMAVIGISKKNPNSPGRIILVKNVKKDIRKKIDDFINP